MAALGEFQFGTVADWLVGGGTLALAFVGFWSARKAGEAAQAATDLTKIEAARQEEQRKAEGTADVRFVVKLVDNAPEFFVVNVGRSLAADVRVRPFDPRTEALLELDAGQSPIDTLLAGQELQLRRRGSEPLPARVRAIVSWSDLIGRRVNTIEAHVPVSDDQARALSVVTTGTERQFWRLETVITNLSDHVLGPIYVRVGDRTGVRAEQTLGGLLGPKDSKVHRAEDLGPEPWAEVEFVDFRGYSWVRRSNGRLRLHYPDLVTELVTDSPERTDTDPHDVGEPDA